MATKKASTVKEAKPTPLFERYLRLYDSDIVDWLKEQAIRNDRTVVQQIKYTLRIGIEHERGCKQ